MKLYQKLAHLVAWYQNTLKSKNTEWNSFALDCISDLMKATSPSGSGIDSGTSIDISKSTPDRLVFDFSYHHMDQHGCYDRWTDHQAIVTGSLTDGFDLRITGRNHNQVKDYLHDVYSSWLNSDFVEPQPEVQISEVTHA